MDTFIGMISVSVQIAMPEYHRLGGLNHICYFSQFWSLGSPRSGASRPISV